MPPWRHHPGSCKASLLGQAVGEERHVEEAQHGTRGPHSQGCDDIPQSSEKLQNESSPNFSRMFIPNVSSSFAPNFARKKIRRGFRASFRGKRRPEKKNHQKSSAFFNAKFPKNSKKNPEKFFWRAGQVAIPQSFALSLIRRSSKGQQTQGPERFWGL